MGNNCEVREQVANVPVENTTEISHVSQEANDLLAQNCSGGGSQPALPEAGSMDFGGMQDSNSLDSILGNADNFANNDLCVSDCMPAGTPPSGHDGSSSPENGGSSGHQGEPSGQDGGSTGQGDVPAGQDGGPGATNPGSEVLPPTVPGDGQFPPEPSSYQDLGKVTIDGNDIDALSKLGTVTRNPDGTLTLDAGGRQLPELELRNVNGLKIQNAVFANTRFGVFVENSSNVTVANSRFENTGAGFMAHNSSDLHVEGNYFHNMQGPYPQASAVQFDHVSGVNSISGNQMINELGQNHMEDVINIFGAAGTVAIDNNVLRGSGGSPSGAAITVGDHGSEGNFLIRNNIVDFQSGDANGGIQIVGGNALVEGNDVTVIDPPNGGMALMIYRYEGSQLGELTVRNNRFRGTNPRWIGDGINVNGLETNQFG
jgi:parallel beta-helix repeat protein